MSAQQTPPTSAAPTGFLGFVRRMPDLFDGICVGAFFCVVLAYAGAVRYVQGTPVGIFRSVVVQFALLVVLAFTPSQFLFTLRNRIRFGRDTKAIRFSALTRAQLQYALGVLATCAVLLPAFMLAN